MWFASASESGVVNYAGLCDLCCSAPHGTHKNKYYEPIYLLPLDALRACVIIVWTNKPLVALSLALCLSRHAHNEIEITVAGRVQSRVYYMQQCSV